MSDDQNDTTSQLPSTDQLPWEKWNLTPYQPEDEDTSPAVSLCVVSETEPRSLCRFMRRGRYKKMSRCFNYAASGSTYCTYHRRHAKP